MNSASERDIFLVLKTVASSSERFLLRNFSRLSVFPRDSWIRVLEKVDIPTSPDDCGSPFAQDVVLMRVKVFHLRTQDWTFAVFVRIRVVRFGALQILLRIGSKRLRIAHKIFSKCLEMGVPLVFDSTCTMRNCLDSSTDTFL